MRILFCDLCDESVPESDLAKGRAVQRGGRTICRRCEESMHGKLDALLAGANPETPSSSPTSPGARAVPGPAVHPTPPSSGGHANPWASGGGGSGLATTLAVVALLFACGASVFLLQRVQRVARDSLAAREGWRDELARSNARLGAELGREIEGVRDVADEARNRVRDVEERVGEGDLQAELARLGAEVEALSARAGQGGRGAEPSAERVAALGEELEALRARNAALARRVLALESSEGSGGAGDGEAEGEPEGAAPAGATSERPEWWPQVLALEQANSGARWGAVQALGETGDPAVAEYLLGMLEDPDIFVRMATARVLGELGARLAIPALIDALEDAEPSVREAAALSLRSLSGQELAFEPNADGPTRERQVAAWRAWWESAGPGILGQR